MRVFAEIRLSVLANRFGRIYANTESDLENFQAGATHARLRLEITIVSNQVQAKRTHERPASMRLLRSTLRNANHTYPSEPHSLRESGWGRS